MSQRKFTNTHKTSIDRTLEMLHKAMLIVYKKMVMHRNTFSSNLQRSDHPDKIDLQGTTIQLCMGVWFPSYEHILFQ